MHKQDKIIDKIRRSSRDMVREFGILSNKSPYDIPLDYRHVLIELGTHGALTHTEIGSLLNLDKFKISRLIKSMIEKKIVTATSSESDQRFRHIVLTESGKKLLDKVNEIASHQVNCALDQLTTDEQHHVVLGMNLYVKALKMARLKSEYTIRKIHKKDNMAMSLIIRNTLKDYGGDLPGTAYFDEELMDMHKSYSDNKSFYFVIEKNSDKKIVGGAGFAPLKSASKTVCELRKMYLSPDSRGLGLGKILLQTVLDAATQFGYRKCYAETLENMHKAKKLYKQTGFRNLDKPMGDTGHYNCNEWLIKEMT